MLGFFPCCTFDWDPDCGGKTTNIDDWGQAKKLSLLKEDSLHLKPNGLIISDSLLS